MLTTDDHGDLLRHVNATDAPALIHAHRIAKLAALALTDALRSAGIGPDQATVLATVADARPLVVVVRMDMQHRAAHVSGAELLAAVLPSRAAGLSSWIDAGGGEPPMRRGRGTGRVA